MLKNNCFILLFIFSVLVSAKAQDELNVNHKGTYVRLDIGYGFGAGVHSPIGETTLMSLGAEVSNLGATNETRRNIYGTYGKGLNATLSIGHKFNNYIGAELGLGYLLGAKQTIIDISDNDGGTDLAKTYTRQFRIKPAVVFEAPSNKLIPFARIGLNIPVAGASYGERDANDPELLSSAAPILYPNAVAFRGESVAKGKFAIGFDMSAGVKYPLTNKLYLGGEIFYTSLRVKRKNYEVTKAVLLDAEGGEEDISELLNAFERYVYTEYKDEINNEELANYQTTAGTQYGTKEFPAWALREDGLFNAIGVNIGLTFKF